VQKRGTRLRETARSGITPRRTPLADSTAHLSTIKENDMIKPVVPDNENGSNPDVKAASFMPGEKIGLAAWMDRVTAELDRAQHDFSPDAICVSLCAAAFSSPIFIGRWTLSRIGEK
jgi:hypothetical protein